MLHAGLWPWAGVALAGWVGFAAIQEPAALQRADVPLFWASAEAGALLISVAIPFVWIAQNRGPSTVWSDRFHATPWQSPIASWLGMTLVICTYSLATLALCYTAYRILGGVGGGPGSAELAFAGTALWAMSLASLAPAIAAIPQPISTLALLWLGLAIASLLIGFPMPTGDFVIPASSTRIAEPSWLASALGTLLATTAGLLFSCGSASRRLLTNAHRNPRRRPQ